MDQFVIDKRLADDCHVLGQLGHSYLLLHKNASVPWFILVPHSSEVELHALKPDVLDGVMAEVRSLARFIEQRFDVHKINVGAIGNIVRQLHLHVIGRRTDDPCWPGVVWGNLEQVEAYDEGLLKNLVSDLVSKQGLTVEVKLTTT